MKENKSSNKITQAEIKLLFNYIDGSLYWKIHKWINKIGKPAARLAKKKEGVYYKRISIKKKVYGEHQLVFLYHNGHIPAIVDHEDGDTLNNRNNNLRAATTSQNAANRKVKPSSTSKYLGVSRRKFGNKKWCVSMTSKGQKITVGYFYNETEAALTYNKKAVEFHGEFAKLNIIKP